MNYQKLLKQLGSFFMFILIKKVYDNLLNYIPKKNNNIRNKNSFIFVVINPNLML